MGGLVPAGSYGTFRAPLALAFSQTCPGRSLAAFWLAYAVFSGVESVLVSLKLEPQLEPDLGT